MSVIVVLRTENLLHFTPHVVYRQTELGIGLLLMTRQGMVMEAFYKFCDLRCDDDHHQDTLVTGVFKGDRVFVVKAIPSNKEDSDLGDQEGDS